MFLCITILLYFENIVQIAALFFLVSFVDLVSSIRYAHREMEDPAETYAGVFEYELENRAYGEVMEDYYVRRMDNFTLKTESFLVEQQR